MGSTTPRSGAASQTAPDNWLRIAGPHPAGIGVSRAEVPWWFPHRSRDDFKLIRARIAALDAALADLDDPALSEFWRTVQEASIQHGVHLLLLDYLHALQAFSWFDQSYYWTPEWQADQQVARAELAAGLGHTFDRVEAALAFLRADEPA